MSGCRKTCATGLFRDEKGVTTTAMAVSIMLSLALIFTGAQAYKVTSASTEIQEVADACALAAESEIAEFMVCVKVCDAAVLSLSLLAGTSFGLGVVCACVPPLEALSGSLISIGNKALKARNSFAETASKGLDKLQKALPFLAAASASSVASANNAGAMHADYTGLAILLPQKGEKIEIGAARALGESASDITDAVPDIQKKAKDAEEAVKKAQKAKEEAYRLDCGNNPGYCQYERAGRFSWMPESENPFFSNVDAWSFSVALERAKAYYAYREGREIEPEGSIADKASYFVRMKFYSYASEKLETEGYVNEDGSSFDAYFPKLFRNMSEFRQTSLYTSASFPVTCSDDEDKGTMHAWSGCPAIAEVSSYDTISALDAGVYTGCTTCGFSVESLGNVASASTNVSNGFEYHYERIRQQAEKYQKAISDADPLIADVEEMAQPLFDSLADALKDIGGYRINAHPCGSIGAIAIVINKADASSDEGFENLFVRNPGTLGTRVAVSGAALVEDGDDDTSDVISSLLDAGQDGGGALMGGAKVALDCWSGLLKVYESGQKTLEKTISSAISSLSLGSLTGLGDWAAGVLHDVVSDVGLEPANLHALKPVILNTGHLASASSDTFSVNFSKVRRQALSASSASGTLFGGISSWVSGLMQGVSSKEITIAEIKFPVGDLVIPITIALPEGVCSFAENALTEGVKAIEGLSTNHLKRKAWQ